MKDDQIEPIDLAKMRAAGKPSVHRAAERLEATGAIRHHVHPEDHCRGDTGESAEDPHDRHYNGREPPLALGSERMNDSEVPIDSDQRQSDDTDVDRQLFDERPDWT